MNSKQIGFGQMNTQVGFDLKSTKNYATPERAQVEVERACADIIAAGVCFNIIIVEQRDASKIDMPVRYVPLLSCWRGEGSGGFTPTQSAIWAAMRGFTVFA